MSSWLRLLPLELDMVENLHEPRTPIDSPRETVIGEVSDFLRRLYTYWRYLDKENADLRQRMA